MGPLKQYTTEKVDRPLTLTIYPGADGHFILYDDDGVSFNYQKGQYTRVELRWDDRARRLTIAPEHISGTWNEITRNLEIRLATSGAARRVRFSDKIQSVQF
jgi:alpha-glucosidase (family GH31 glycosyl hydrolase)